MTRDYAAAWFELTNAARYAEKQNTLQIYGSDENKESRFFGTLCADHFAKAAEALGFDLVERKQEAA